MTTYAYELISPLSIRYGDEITFLGAGAGSWAITTNGTRITAADWMDFIDEGIKQLILVRPDANVEVESVQTVAGAKQELPDDSQVLIDVLYNMGTDGATRGTPITFVDRKTFDMLDTDWQTETPSDTIIHHYTYDKRMPRIFFIYPRAVAGSLPYIEIATSKIPTALSTINSTLEIDSLFINAIKDWALYLAYSLDTDSKVNTELAQWYYNAFYQALNLELESGVTVSPPEMGLKAD